MFFIKKERGFIMSSIDSAIDLNAGSVSENVKTTLRGELVLAFAVIINSLGVVLMLYSGTGISAISSVPYAFSEVRSEERRVGKECRSRWSPYH